MPLSKELVQQLQANSPKSLYLPAKLRGLSSDDLKIVGNLLSKHLVLKNITLNANSLGRFKEDLKDLKLGKLKALQTLEISTTQLGDLKEHIQYLMLAELDALQKLEINQNNLGDLGENIKDLMLGKLKSLQNLSIDFNNLGNLQEHIAQLGLGELKALQTLNLNKNKLGNLGKLCQHLKLGELKVLQELTISHNSIGNLGKNIKELRLAKLKTLQKLRIHGNNLSDLGEHIQALGLGELNSLKEFEISSNNLGDLGVLIKDLGLGKLNALQSLSIMKNKLGNLGEHFKNLGLGELKALQELDISSNNLGNLGEHFHDFITALSNMHSLGSLTIYHNNFSPDQLQQCCQMFQNSFSLIRIPFTELDDQTRAILRRNQDLSINHKLDTARKFIKEARTIPAENSIFSTQKLGKQLDILKTLLDDLSTYKEEEARIQEARVGDVIFECIELYKARRNPAMVEKLELTIPESHPKYEEVWYAKFTHEMQSALYDKKNLSKAFIKALPYYIKRNNTFMQNNFDLFFDGILARIVGQEAKFETTWETEERTDYLQFVLLKGLAKEYSDILGLSSLNSPRFQASVAKTSIPPNLRKILKGLKDLPNIISLEPEDKSKINKLFDEVKHWADASNNPDAKNWIKLMTAVDNLSKSPELNREIQRIV